MNFLCYFLAYLVFRGRFSYLVSLWNMKHPQILPSSAKAPAQIWQRLSLDLFFISPSAPPTHPPTRKAYFWGPAQLYMKIEYSRQHKPLDCWQPAQAGLSLAQLSSSLLIIGAVLNHMVRRGGGLRKYYTSISDYRGVEGRGSLYYKDCTKSDNRF